MIKLIRKHQHRIFPILDIALNGVNYLFHVFVTWFLLPSQYGILNSLLSLLAILMVVGIAFQTHTARQTASGGASGFLFKAAILFSAVIALILLIFSKSISALMGCDREVLILIGTVFVLNVFLSIFRGFLQGKKEFFRLNISLYLEMLAKILFLVLFLPASKDFKTVLLSLIVGMGVSLLHGLWCYIKQVGNSAQTGLKEGLGSVAARILWIYASSFFFYYFISIDMIVVNYFLRDQSGLYAVSVKYAQIAVYAASSIVTVFLPTLSSFAGNDREYRRYFLKSLLLLSLIEGGILLLNGLIMPHTVSLFFHEGYALASDYVFSATVPYAFLGLCNLLINANIARDRRGYMGILLGFSIVLVTALVLFSTSIARIIMVETLTYGTMFLVLLAHLLIRSGMLKTGVKV